MATYLLTWSRSILSANVTYQLLLLDSFQLVQKKFLMVTSNKKGQFYSIATHTNSFKHQLQSINSREVGPGALVESTQIEIFSLFLGCLQLSKPLNSQFIYISSDSKCFKDENNMILSCRWIVCEFSLPNDRVLVHGMSYYYYFNNIQHIYNVIVLRGVV